MNLIIDADKLLQALLKAPEVLAKEIDRAIDRSLHLFARSAKDKAPKAFSTLTQSIDVDRYGPYEGTVGPGVDYAQAVEQGTDAAGIMPPVEHIHEWVKVQGLTPLNADEDSLDVAWRIAKKIAVSGTPAQPYMQPAYEDNEAEAQRLLDQALDNTLAFIG